MDEVGAPYAITLAEEQSSDDTWHPDDDESDCDQVDEDAWMVQFYTR